MRKIDPERLGPAVNEVYGEGLLLGDDVVLKAHLRVQSQAHPSPVVQGVIDSLGSMYASCAEEIKESLPFSLGRSPLEKSAIFILQDGTVGHSLDIDLLKAGYVPGSMATSAPPSSGGFAGSAVQPREDPKTPGSRGGKWYRDKRGKIRYDKNRPSPGEEMTELSPPEVREHLRHFRPSPFIGQTGADREFVEHLRSNAGGYGFSEAELKILEWWHERGLRAFVEGYRGLSLDDLKGDLGNLVLQDEEAGSLTYEEALESFLADQDWGDANFDSDVKPLIESLLHRYRKALDDPAIQASLEAVGRQVEEGQYRWFAKASSLEKAVEPLGTVISSGLDVAETPFRVLNALAALEIVISPSKGSLKGLIIPNDILLSERSIKPGILFHPGGQQRLPQLSSPELMLVYVGAALGAIWNSKDKSFSDIGHVPSTKLGKLVLDTLREKSGISKDDIGTLAVIRRRMDEATFSTARAIDGANFDSALPRAVFDAGRAGRVSEFEVKSARDRLVQTTLTNDAALEAQGDDSFDSLPKTMLDGIFGGQIESATGKPYELFQHQKQALNWMEAAKRGVLALGPGLGKTAVVTTFVEQLRAKGKIVDGEPAIVFMPPSLMYQWPGEIQKYAPGAAKAGGILNLSGMNLEERKTVLKSPLVQKARYILLSTGTLNGPLNPGEHGDGGTDNELADILREIPGPLFVDEVHASGAKEIANTRYRLLQHVIGDREHAFGVTGTPIPNSPIDAYNMADLFAPGSVGSREVWDGKLKGVQWDPSTGKWEHTNPQNIAEMRSLLQSRVFYKKLSDPEVEADMGKRIPDPWYRNHDLVPPDEMMAYLREGGIVDRMTEAKLEEIDQDRKSRGLFPLENGKGRDFARAALRLGLRRQASISPEIIDPSYVGPAPKIDRMVSDVLDHFRSGQNKPVVVFSSYPESVFDIVSRKFVERGVHESMLGQIDGTRSSAERGFLQDMTNQGKIKILLVGVKSGGAGINLQTKANRVFYVDEPYDPGAKTQATARVVRVGQTDVAHVHTYRMAGEAAPDWSTEDRLAGKQVMASWILGKAPNPVLLAAEAEEDSADVAGRTTKEAVRQAQRVGLSREPGKKKRRGKKPVDPFHILKMGRKIGIGPELLGEEFFDVSEDTIDSPDLNARLRGGAKYAKYYDKTKAESLAKEAPALAGQIAQRKLFRGWIQKKAEEQAQVKFSTISALIETHETGGDGAKANLYRRRLRKLVLNYPDQFSSAERAQAGIEGGEK